MGVGVRCLQHNVGMDSLGGEQAKVHEYDTTVDRDTTTSLLNVPCGQQQPPLSGDPDTPLTVGHRVLLCHLRCLVLDQDPEPVHLEAAQTQDGLEMGCRL